VDDLVQWKSRKLTAENLQELVGIIEHDGVEEQQDLDNTKAFKYMGHCEEINDQP
jgi:hypothetical protein